MKANQSEDLLEFQADHVWIGENHEELLGQYPDQWIAVKGKKVIASAPDLNTLMSRLPDPAHTCVEYMAREPIEMIL